MGIGLGLGLGIGLGLGLRDVARARVRGGITLVSMATLPRKAAHAHLLPSIGPMRFVAALA